MSILEIGIAERIGMGDRVGISVSPADDPAALEQAFAVRRTVFVVEQGVGLPLEFDGKDQAAEHLLARTADGRTVGTLRLRRIGDRTGKIERVAVLKEARGLGAGAALIEAALCRLRDRAFAKAVLHAQTYAIPFYEKLGFTAHGEVFDEDGIPHIAMRQRLDDPTAVSSDRMPIASL